MQYTVNICGREVTYEAAAEVETFDAALERIVTLYHVFKACDDKLLPFGEDDGVVHLRGGHCDVEEALQRAIADLIKICIKDHYFAAMLAGMDPRTNKQKKGRRK